MAAPGTGGARRALDAALFGSGWVALAAAALCAAASRALELPVRLEIVALAFCGTLSVYTVDRLRDVARDRDTSPERTVFVIAHARGLRWLAALAGLTAAGLGLRAGPGAVVLLAVVLGVGLLHRRLKHVVAAKPVYLTGSWTAVAVGLPAVAAPGEAGSVLAVGALVAACVASNVVLSNLRDGEGAAARLGRRPALAVALVLLAPALGIGLAGAAPVRGLLPLPLAMGAAVLGFRPTERYGLLVVDGALLVGALPAALGLA